MLEFLLQVVRSRLQEQGRHSEKRYSGVIDCIKKVFHQEGIQGFYRGCATNLIRTTPAAVITFTSFEMIHRFLVTLFPADPHPHPLQDVATWGVTVEAVQFIKSLSEVANLAAAVSSLVVYLISCQLSQRSHLGHCETNLLYHCYTEIDDHDDDKRC